MNEGKRALGDVHGVVSHALQIVIDLDGGRDKTQVGGHRLLEGEQPRRQVIDLNFHLIDASLVLQRLLRLLLVLLSQRKNAAVNPGLHQAAHFQQALSEIIELLVKVTHVKENSVDYRQQPGRTSFPSVPSHLTRPLIGLSHLSSLLSTFYCLLSSYPNRPVI